MKGGIKMNAKRTFSLFSILLLFTVELHAQDWPQWRGPNRDGSAAGFTPAETWPDSLQPIWSRPIGAGISSPVLAEDKIFLLTRESDEEIVLCLNSRDGKENWRQSYPAPFIPNPQAVRPQLFPKSMGKGPFATPLVHEGRLYTLGVTRTFSCFDAVNGRLKWRQTYFSQALPDTLKYICPPCGCEHDGKTFAGPGMCPSCGMAFGVEGLDTSVKSVGNYYGAASSPVIYKNWVIIHVGNNEKSAIFALDKRTGAQKWVWQGKAMSSSSPIVATLHGVPQVINLTRHNVVGVAADTGDLLWSFPLESNAQIVTPVVFEDLVIFSTYRGAAQALKIAKNSNQWQAEAMWKSDDMSFFMSSPVSVGDRLVALSYLKRGQFACINARSGQTIWAGPGRQATAAMILNLGKALMALEDDGELVVFDATADTFTELARYKVADAPTWAYPVVWDNKILVKDEANLSLWGLK